MKGSVVEFDKALELDPRQRPCAVINFPGWNQSGTDRLVGRIACTSCHCLCSR